MEKENEKEKDDALQDASRKVTIDKLKELEKELEEAAEQQAEDVAAEEAGEEVSEESSEKSAEETTEEAEAEDAEKEASEEDPEEKTEKPKKKLFGGKDKKKDKLQEQIDELKDKNLRQMAEFENYRRRTEKEKQAMFETGAKSVIEKLLPIVDNFERGIEALSEEELKSPVGEGMNLIYKQLADALKDMGVEEIEAEGKEFDPELHNAVMHEENDEYDENVIIEVLQKGYKFHDTVIRHSLVKVAN
jgi:molecular chaperone GrpE